MAKFVKGDVVVLNFPFSDLSGSKRRPALVVANLNGNDILLYQITSQQSINDIAIMNKDFITGSLPVNSYIKPHKLFTADQNIIIKTAGRIKDTITKDVISQIINVLEL